MEKSLKFLILFTLVVFAFTVYVTYFAAYHLSSLPPVLSAQEAADKAVNYINNEILDGASASLVDVTEESGLYRVHIMIGQNEYYSYVSKDGRLLFEQAIYIADGGGGSVSAVTEIPQSDRPDVKIFIMSYCPYGLQVQKMMLPVYELLQDEIDVGIYFVDYLMHGEQELDENLRQYCMQLEDQSKYFEYLSCFVQSGDCEACMAEAGIDTANLSSCMSATDAAYNISAGYDDSSTWRHGNPTFDVHNDLNEMYGVTGSPAIIINGVKVNVYPRTPENFKQVICSAFNTSPDECSQTLSNEVPSPGFD